uniref:Cytochrome P450 n=1 Tax=Solanum tuberosum TaxID=4113 RepID=M1ALC4_SOLTU
MELLSAKNVKSFNSIRQDEGLGMIEFFRSSSGETVNATKRIFQFASSMTCRSAFGKVFKEQDELILLVKKVSRLTEGFDVADIFPSLKFLHVLCGMKGKIMDVHHELNVILENIINEHKNNGELGGEGLVAALLRVMKEGGHQFPITNDNIKAIIFDIFAAGTETSSATIDWTMVEMMRNPNVLSKAQEEVRNAFKGKETFDENDVEELKYLKPMLIAAEIVCYNGSDIVFSPYGDYWRQMRKICIMELLSAKNVKSFNSIRQDEVLGMIEFFRSSSGETVNATKRIFQFASSMTCRSAFGKVFKEKDEFIQVVKKVSHIMEGFDVADLFPSLKFLHVLCGMKSRIMDVHHELDVILEKIINEHKNNGELGGEGLVAALIEVMKEGGL